MKIKYEKKYRKLIINRKKIFLRFLKENNLYINYVNNMKENYEIKKPFNCKSLQELYENNMHIKEYMTEIEDAFDWNDSKEEFSTWENLDDEWKKLMSNVKNKLKIRVENEYR